MKILAILIVLALAACHQEEKPQAPTPAEAERLNDVEAMLNGLANEEGPATEAADPSKSN